MPGADGRRAQGIHRDHWSADGAGPGGVAAVAGGGQRQRSPSDTAPPDPAHQRRDDIIVSGEHYLVANPTRHLEGQPLPDLLVAFGADSAASEAGNGYDVSEQGKPPDFVMEVAPESKAETDVGAKRAGYAALDILEYWRFQETEQGSRRLGCPESGWWTARKLPSRSMNRLTGVCNGTAPC